MELHVTRPGGLLCRGLYTVSTDDGGESHVATDWIAVIRVDAGADLTIHGQGNKFAHGLVVYGPGKITLVDVGTTFHDVECNEGANIAVKGRTTVARITGGSISMVL